MDDIPALLALEYYSSAMIATPDDPAAFEMYWRNQPIVEYTECMLRYNKHRIMRYLLDKKEIDVERAAVLCYRARFYNKGELNMVVMHILDANPPKRLNKAQKAFCKVRFQCRMIALILLHAGKFRKDYRDVIAIIARIVWGMRGYCKIETEIIKIKRLCF